MIEVKTYIFYLVKIYRFIINIPNDKFSFNDRDVSSYKLNFAIHNNQVTMYTFGMTREELDKTSKTLGIINQTIPLVRQVKPVMNNVRSMMKIASIFKDETDDVVVNNYMVQLSIYQLYRQFLLFYDTNRKGM